MILPFTHKQATADATAFIKVHSQNKLRNVTFSLLLTSSLSDAGSSRAPGLISINWSRSVLITAVFASVLVFAKGQGGGSCADHVHMPNTRVKCV